MKFIPTERFIPTYQYNLALDSICKLYNKDTEPVMTFIESYNRVYKMQYLSTLIQYKQTLELYMKIPYLFYSSFFNSKYFQLHKELIYVECSICSELNEMYSANRIQHETQLSCKDALKNCNEHKSHSDFISKTKTERKPISEDNEMILNLIDEMSFELSSDSSDKDIVKSIKNDNVEHSDEIEFNPNSREYIQNTEHAQGDDTLDFSMRDNNIEGRIIEGNIPAQENHTESENSSVMDTKEILNSLEEFDSREAQKFQTCQNLNDRNYYEDKGFFAQIYKLNTNGNQGHQSQYADCNNRSKDREKTEYLSFDNENMTYVKHNTDKNCRHNELKYHKETEYSSLLKSLYSNINDSAEDSAIELNEENINLVGDICSNLG